MLYEFDTRNDPPRIEPIFIAAAAFLTGVLMILVLLLATA
jgi:hypothetical protein